MKGALTPQPNGVVALAPPDDTASDRATAYVTSQSGKPVAILFVTTKGKGANFSGMLFVDTSIDSLNRRKDSDGIDTVEINAPNPLPPPNDAETCRVRFESTADAGWYRVSCNLD